MPDTNDIIIGAGALIATLAGLALVSGQSAGTRVRETVSGSSDGQSLAETAQQAVANMNPAVSQLADAGVTEAIAIDSGSPGDEYVPTDRENQQEFEERAHELQDEVGAIGPGGTTGSIVQEIRTQEIIESQQTENWIDETQDNPTGNLL